MAPKADVGVFKRHGIKLRIELHGDRVGRGPIWRMGFQLDDDLLCGLA